MIRIVGLGLLLALAACNRAGTADVTLDADAAQRNTTAAKTLADLAAADAASQGPAPVVRDAPPLEAKEVVKPVRAAPVAATEEAPAIEVDDSVANDN